MTWKIHHPTQIEVRTRHDTKLVIGPGDVIGIPYAGKYYDSARTRQSDVDFLAFAFTFATEAGIPHRYSNVFHVGCLWPAKDTIAKPAAWFRETTTTLKGMFDTRGNPPIRYADGVVHTCSHKYNNIAFNLKFTEQGLVVQMRYHDKDPITPPGEKPLAAEYTLPYLPFLWRKAPTGEPDNLNLEADRFVRVDPTAAEPRNSLPPSPIRILPVHPADDAEPVLTTDPRLSTIIGMWYRVPPPVRDEVFERMRTTARPPHERPFGAD